jgi:enoyl-CoA hydratase/carnithine racemase/NAD(P)-dependent dehydrogenase (short-subunit alcohol dehydrogenase family)/acyl carrier protein/SAM-dependent methyltransferase
MSTTRIRGQFTIRDTDPLVNSHRVQDIHILPGVAQLDAVFKTLRSQRIDLSGVALRSIMFHEPVVTNAQIDRKVTVTVDMNGGDGRITVTSLPWKNDRALAADATTHMTCVLAPGEPFDRAPAAVSAKALPADAVDLDACYGVTRHIGIFHDNFMKCSGRVAPLPSGQHLGAVALGPDAFSRSTDFLLHPVFLDCSTIVPLFPLRNRLDETSLFIPFAIEEFRAVAFGARRDVRVLVEPLEADPGTGELLRYSFGIFDDEGRRLAAVRNFTVKKVRSLQNIRALLERSLSVPASPATAAPSSARVAAQPPAPAPSTAAGAGDPISDLIGGLLSRQGSFVWSADQARKPFFDLGLDSLALLDAAESLEKQLGVRIYPTALFENPNVAALTAHLRTTYPDACDAYAQRAPKTAAVEVPAVPARPAADTADPVLALIAELARPHLAGDWKPEHAGTSFFDLGLDSVMLLDLAETLEQRLGVRLYPTVLFERPNPAALVSYLREEFPEACAKYAPARVSAPAVPAIAPAAPTAPAAPIPTPAPQPVSLRPEVLVPRWFPARPDATPSAAQSIALVGTAGDVPLRERLEAELGSRVSFRGGATEFAAALAAGSSCDEVCFVAVDHDAVFAVVKALIQANRLTSPLTVRAITLNCFRVHEEGPHDDAAHGVWGLLQSLSREYPKVTVAQFDLSRVDVTTGSSDWVALALAAAPTRTLCAIRGGRVYRRALCPAQSAAAATSTFRRGGTYMVVGGASGVGLELVRHLRRNYAANVAVIGRRPESAEIVRALTADGDYGREVVYLSAAVDDEPALTRAIQTARAKFGELHGVVHSAMVLEDRLLADMDEACFERVLKPKATGALSLARATAGLELDFMLFFSSAQSFVGNLGQANYAAASTFVDGFASALRANRSHPVVVINWGFWSEVGAVASERYRQLMARQGVYGLQSADALAALEDVLASGWEQAAIVSAEESVLEEMGLDRSIALERAPLARVSGGEAPVAAVTSRDAQVFAETEVAMSRLLEVTRRRVAQILRELLAGQSVEEALASRALASQHVRLVRALLAVTRADAADSPGLSEAEFAIAIAQLRERFPVLSPLIPLLQAAISAYPNLLTGKALAATVLFPGGGVDLVRPVYGQSEISRFYNERVAQAVLFLSRQTRGPLRILEIGAGTGSTTIEILVALARAGVECEYWYTELWDKLVDEAKARLGSQYPQLRFAFFDVGIDPAEQGLHTEFDVVVATNVLHATRDLHATLRHTKKLLRPGGALVLNESVEVQEYSTYTFGLLPGWWNAIDPHERLADSPLASASRWPALLRDEGFVQVRPLVPADPPAAAVSAQQVYLAFSDGELRTGGGKKPVPSTRAGAPTGLPPALAGKLRAFAPPAAPRAKHVATFKDERDNIWVFLNNPPANMFTDEFLGELCAALQSVATLPSGEGRLVYLSHFGEYFSLGGDRSELVRTMGDPDAIAAFAEKARALIKVITSLDALVVAVVNGTAQGGGFETLLATDLQIVRAGVKLGVPEIKSGLIPGMGGLTYLQHVIGPARTKRLVMTGDLVEAEQAQAWGLISDVVSDPFVAALALADAIKSLEAALYMKRILRGENVERLTADIDDWVAYITRHSEWIDTKRISNSKLVVTARAAMREQ